jgi:hypothetical protein
MNDLQFKKLAAIADIVYNSPDLAARCIIELHNRRVCAPETVADYLQTVL